MKFTVFNYRKIIRAEIEAAPFALVAAINAHGKTSLAQAIATALSPKLSVLDAVSTQDAGVLVHTGAAKADITVATADGEVAVSLPKGDRNSNGQPPRASAFALGLRSVVELPAKESTPILLEYMKAEAAKADVAEALAGTAAESLVDNLWEKIQSLGWDGEWSRAKQIGANLKGQWEHATGERRWGGDKATKWIPPGWADDLDGASEASLQQGVTDAESFLETAIANGAVTLEDRTRLEQAAAPIDDLTRQITELSSAIGQTEAAINKAKNARDQLPRPDEIKDDSAERTRLTKLVDSIAGLEQRLDSEKSRRKIAVASLDVAKNARNALDAPGPAEQTLVLESDAVLGNCPHPKCKKPVGYKDGAFFIPATDDQKKARAEAAKEAQARKVRIREADAKVESCENTLTTVDNEIERLQRSIASAEGAREPLAQLPDPAAVAEQQRVNAERKQALDDAAAAIERLEQNVKEQNQQGGQLRAQLKSATDAKTQLDTLPAELISQSHIDQCRTARDGARRRLEAFQKKTEADRLAAEIHLNQMILGHLAPTGIRQTKLTRAITEFNQSLADLCKIAGWQLVKFDSNLTPTYADWSYPLLSESEQYRVRLVVQIAMALLDGSQLVLCDRADILDSGEPHGEPKDGISRGRPGLLKLLLHLGQRNICSVFFMTERYDRLPQLAGLGGRVYWLDGGITTPVEERKAA